MVRKNSLDRGNDTYTMLIDLILGLSPNQVKLLYQELKARYTTRAHTKKWTPEGEVDKEKGRIRLTEYQFKALRLKFGETYMKHALFELDNYIKFLELHQDESKYRGKLCQINSRTHSKELDYGGWVYDKCKKYINKLEECNLSVNPLLIEDFSVAKKYIELMPISMRRQPDVLFLIEKFPELEYLLNQQDDSIQ